MKLRGNAGRMQQGDNEREVGASQDFGIPALDLFADSQGLIQGARAGPGPGPGSGPGTRTGTGTGAETSNRGQNAQLVMSHMLEKDRIVKKKTESRTG